ncbi:MAG TPA: hypothetical protein VM165_13970, partial [Planctomycetaceae bacterium]|nr:hypothetical protein [Planctomycetaceae bacterium]
MENLFRLALARPAITQSEETPSIQLAQNSPFQAALGQAQQADKRRDALKAAARQFINSPGFVGDPKALAIYAGLKTLRTKLDALETNDDVVNADVAK